MHHIFWYGIFVASKVEQLLHQHQLLAVHPSQKDYSSNVYMCTQITFLYVGWLPDLFMVTVCGGTVSNVVPSTVTVTASEKSTFTKIWGLVPNQI